MEEKIIGYGVFESVDGEILVCYYTIEDTYDGIEEGNFYEDELTATQVALTVANEKLAGK